MTEFELWLEFEHWTPDDQDDPVRDFFNMKIVLSSGATYALNVWTYGYVASAREHDRRTGENLGGQFMEAPDLFVERCGDRQLCEEIVAHLISTGSLREEWRVDPLATST